MDRSCEGGLPAILARQAPQSIRIESGIEEISKEVDAALAEEEWVKADALIDRIFAATAGRDFVSVPAYYQQLYFKKGWCALKQEKWKDAMRAFETCYKKFPDRSTNPFHREALRGWGDAAVGAGDAATAARMYRKYIQEASSANWNNPFKKRN